MLRVVGPIPAAVSSQTAWPLSNVSDIVMWWSSAAPLGVSYMGSAHGNAEKSKVLVGKDAEHSWRYRYHARFQGCAAQLDATFGKACFPRIHLSRVSQAHPSSVCMDFAHGFDEAVRASQSARDGHSDVTASYVDRALEGSGFMPDEIVARIVEPLMLRLV